MNLLRANRLIIQHFLGGALLLLGVFTSGCSGRGVPGSWLLTPVDQPVVFSATLPPLPTETAAATQVPSDPPPAVALPSENSPSPEPTLTFTATASATLQPTEAGTPTFGPSPTRTRTPTRTRFPTRTPTPSRTPTVTQTPTPPLAFLRIQKPGPYSKVSSPLQVEALVSPGEDGYVYVELIGEDGRIITRQALDYRSFMNRYFYINPQVAFELNTAAETARLAVRIQDRLQRPIYLCSVEVVLMRLGRNEITAPVIAQEPYVVRSPREGAVISGGVLRVIGLARLVNNRPLIFELMDE
ncbi:MAG: hypothetical protein ACK4SN_01865, partial [Bellilinea sp.]